MRQTSFLVLLALLTLTRCDNLFIVNYPEGGLAFDEKVKEVKSSQIESLLDTLSGVTSAKGIWEGARVLSPFRYPLLVSLVTVQVTEPLPAAERWQHYAVAGAVDVDTAFHKLDVRMAKQPNTLPAVKLEVDQADAAEPASAGGLNASEPSHRPLLRELGLLAGAGAELAVQPGRRALLLSLDALPALAADAPALAAAGALVREAVERYAAAAAAASGGRAVTLLLTQPALSRRTRSLLAEDDPPAAESRNIATQYTDNYPAIFNILLIISLFLVYILVSFSIMTAYMDPGKDSIIYRMTNPNMKKNN